MAFQSRTNQNLQYTYIQTLASSTNFSFLLLLRKSIYEFSSDLIIITHAYNIIDCRSRSVHILFEDDNYFFMTNSFLFLCSTAIFPLVCCYYILAESESIVIQN